MPEEFQIKVITTDPDFVADLKIANIEGIEAFYRPTMAFDTAEHIFQIVVQGSATVALNLFSAWLYDRIKSHKAKKMLLNNQDVVSAPDKITTIINSQIKLYESRRYQMPVKVTGTLDNFGKPVPTKIEFEDGSTYDVPPNPGGGGDFYSIPLPGKGVICVPFKDIIIQ